MQKPQILWRNQTPSRSSLKLGWKQLSRNAKVALFTFSLLYLGLSIYNSLEQQSAVLSFHEFFNHHDFAYQWLSERPACQPDAGAQDRKWHSMDWRLPTAGYST